MRSGLAQGDDNFAAEIKSKAIRDILLAGQDRLQGAGLVLSAHTDLPLIREAVEKIGYRLDREDAGSRKPEKNTGKTAEGLIFSSSFFIIKREIIDGTKKPFWRRNKG